MNREQVETAAARAGKKQAKPNGAAAPPDPAASTQLEPKRTDWMWHPRIPAGMISILGARGGGCKGLTCMSLTAAVTTKRPWPDGTPSGEPGHVLWCETEDPLCEVVIPRLIAAGAERELVSIASREAFAALDLREYIVRMRTRLIVLSPMLSFLDLEDINHELGVRAVLEKLQASIADTPCAVVGIAHCNKKADLAAIERILGSVAFTNFVRSVLLIAPENVEARTHRLVHCKHNLSAKADDLILKPVHVGEDYRDQYVKLEWSKPESNVDADAIFDRKKVANGKAPSATDWLVEYLTENGESPREVVVIAGEKAGHKADTLERAMMRSPLLHNKRTYSPNRSWWSAN